MKACQSSCSIQSPSHPPSAMDPTSASIVPTASTNNTVLTLISKRIQDLNKKHSFILQEESLGKKRRKVRRSKHRVMGQINELEKLSKEISSLQSCNGQLVNVNVTLDKQRYLCVSNGFAIFCLDLKLNKYQSFSNALDVPPLPEIATLYLLEEHRPISVSLFKLGANAYVLGGQVPPFGAEDPDPSWDENSKDSSRVTHQLSLVEGTLSLSQCNIGKLKKPKVWPIVDKVDGQIHVFDTVPSEMFYGDPDWIFSHEALSDLDGSWITIPTIRDRDTDYKFVGLRDKEYITHHSVIGDRIYAVADGGYLLFVSKMKKWAAYPRCEVWDPFSVKQVWHILDLGYARCAGEFPYGKPSDPLYVLIAVMDGPNVNTFALAYLVTSTGQVVCFQRLPHIYDGPVHPYYMLKGTMIDVNEKGKTMCAIVSAHVRDEDNCEYLFINTFTVEMHADAASEVRQVLWKAAFKDMPVEQEFVRVHLNDRYIYKTGVDKVDDIRRLLPVRACFL